MMKIVPIDQATGLLRRHRPRLDSPTSGFMRDFLERQMPVALRNSARERYAYRIAQPGRASGGQLLFVGERHTSFAPHQLGGGTLACFGEPVESLRMDFRALDNSLGHKRSRFVMRE